MMANPLEVSAFLLLLLPLLADSISIHYAHRFGGRIDDLQGSYCGSRRWGSSGTRWWAVGKSSVCCNGRYDDCSVPILGTMCYCDQFCDRGVTHDCCPDYWDVCVGTPVTPEVPEFTGRCIHAGREFNVGQTITDNCNTCTCTGVVGAAPTATCTRNKCLMDPALSSALRRERDLGWTPVEVQPGTTSSSTAYTEFWGRTLDEGIRLRLGTINPDDSVMGMQKVQFHINSSVSIPPSFDSRRFWPSAITPPEDQGWCASSCIISAATVISNRAIIADNNVQPLIYEHFLDCQVEYRHAADRCSAGYLHRIWKYLTEFGAPEKVCVAREGREESSCKAKPRARCRRELAGPAYRLGDLPRMMYNLKLYGPIQATMRVYHDFFHYKGGVYSRPAGSDDRESYGYHSVRIIGWGEDRTDPRTPIPYWLVANSWGTWWGEGGYFRIRRGTDECDIEKYVLSAWVQPELARRTKRSQEGILNFRSKSIIE